MITKVIGKCNSTDVIFTYVSGDNWQTTIPTNVKGEYIIELWATNDLGVTTYFATIKFTYNPTTLNLNIRVLDVGANFTVKDVQSLFTIHKVGVNAGMGSVDVKFNGGGS